MDFAIVVASFALTHLAARRLGSSGPGTWAVLCALAVASWRLEVTGASWQELGLRLPDNAWHTLAWVAAFYVMGVLTSLLVINPLAKAAGWPPLNLSRFAKLPGNTPLFIGGLLLVWVQAAVGEELVFRGFLLTRLELLLGAGSGAAALAVAGQALVFGVAHWYLGPRGVTNAVLLGLILGATYIADGRDLVPLILAHGLADSVSLVAIYARIVRVPQ
jgi:membrane protease YdiL (CAAX protease family)